VDEYIGIIIFVIFVVISIITNALKKTAEKGGRVERYRGYRGLLWEKPPRPREEEEIEQPPPKELPQIVEEEERIGGLEPSLKEHSLLPSIGEGTVEDIDKDIFEERLKRIFGEEYTDYEDVERGEVGGFPSFEGMSDWARLVVFHTVFEKRSPFAPRRELRR